MFGHPISSPLSYSKKVAPLKAPSHISTKKLKNSTQAILRDAIIFESNPILYHTEAKGVSFFGWLDPRDIIRVALKHQFSYLKSSLT